MDACKTKWSKSCKKSRVLWLRAKSMNFVFLGGCLGFFLVGWFLGGGLFLAFFLFGLVWFWGCCCWVFFGIHV